MENNRRRKLGLINEQATKPILIYYDVPFQNRDWIKSKQNYYMTISTRVLKAVGDSLNEL